MTAQPRGDEKTVDVGLRLSGKTTRLVEWVMAGERAEGYPGWSRILVVPTINEVLRLRKIHRGLHPKQIYSLREWLTAHNVNPETAIALDDADYMLLVLSGWRRGRIERVALSGRILGDEGTTDRG